MFGFNSEYQYNVQLLTIDKSSVLDMNPTTLTTYHADRPLPNSTFTPAVMHGSAPGDPMWFVEEKGLEQDGSYQDLRVVKMTNVLSSTPTFTDYYLPMDAYTITPFPKDLGHPDIERGLAEQSNGISAGCGDPERHERACPLV
jgi:hypothetical protein